MKNKKIGIMTFHRSHNCGSIMQAYAMQKVLSTKFNFKPEFIDFSNDGQHKLYSVFENKLSIKSFVKNVIRLLFYKRLYNNKKSYDAFINKYLYLSKKRYNSLSELNENKLNYDLYLAGSDQIWNIDIQDSDDAYFLPFIKKHPKIAYSVSQGAKNIYEYADNPDKYKKMIKSFDYISVREPNCKKWLKNCFNIESQIVLDPTLLLDAVDYKNIESELILNVKKDKYIFVYATKINKNFEKIIQNIAKKENLKIVIWQPDVWIKKFGWLKGYILPKSQNPGKYLSLMKNAKYVFTASYHGVIFAIQYRKNLWVLKNEGMNLKKDDRILSLLNMFNLSNRLLLESDIKKDVSKKADYSGFESKITFERKKAFNFLNKAISINYESK